MMDGGDEEAGSRGSGGENEGVALVSGMGERST